MPETIADRLRMAAARLRENFGRGRLVDHDGNQCALGAILDIRPPAVSQVAALTGLLPAIYSDQIADGAVTALHRHLVHMSEAGDMVRLSNDGFRIDAITTWNDTIVADGEEAAAVLEKAAARWEERA